MPPADEGGLSLPLRAGSPRISATVSILVFGFGLAAGVLLAFTGYAVMEESASLLITVFLTAIFLITLIGVLGYLLRRPILRYFFGVATTQLELFAKPLSEVAEGAFIRDVKRVTAATGLLVQLTLARYAWMSTRRWIIASLTGLIAALAALAGTALLFKQNELIAAQSELLAYQNDRIALQTELLKQDVQLAEAARNSDIAVGISEIGGLLGAAMVKAGKRTSAASQALGQGATGSESGFVAVLNPFTDLDAQLVMRIASASRAPKPYRFLDPALRAHDDADKLRVAFERRRRDLPEAHARMARYFQWQDPPETDRLIDRPASPERAQLLETMIRAGLREFELLNFYGLDLSFAYAEDIEMGLVSMQGGQLSYANFDRADVISCDFAGASLENTRFRKARISDTAFRGLPWREAKVPFRDAYDDIMPTALAGADFTGARIESSDFSHVNGGAMRFDAATLAGVDFTGAEIGGTTFTDAVLVGVTFDGTGLKSVDFDGAYVFDAGFLARVEAGAVPGSFVADRFRLVEADMAGVMQVASAYVMLTPEDIEARTGSDKVWRVERVRAFETDPAAATP